MASSPTHPLPAAPAATTPSWQEVASGVWRASIGRPEDLTLLSAAGVQPSRSAIAALPAAEFPFERSGIETRQWSGKTALRLPLGLDEEIYGLGVDFKVMRRTGSVFRLHVDHWGGHTGRTHAPVPLYVSSRGYAVLFDSARYLDVSVAHGVRLAAQDKPPVIDRTTGKDWAAMPRSDSVEALVPADGLAVYVFAGPTPLDAIRRYNLFCGGGALPPKWGLGFLARTPTRYSAEQALAEIAAFREHGIPLDMLGLEPGWQDHAYPCSLEWDAARFPDPAGFLAAVKKQHVRVNLWFNPYISPTAPLYPKLLPFAGTHLVWNGIVPDYTIEAARKIFGEHLRKEVLDVDPEAVGGFKIDEVDGYDRYLWPETAVYPSGHDAEQLRQTYGLLLQRLVYDLFRQQNRRTLGQVRGTNAGASPLPFVIYNDNYAFDEYITAVGNSGFAGVLWSPEVRGGKAEDMLRRTQAVCFSPLALFNGWATADKLWTHADVRDHLRAAIVLRLRLLPYFYNTFAQYHFEGTPVIRPMPLVAGFPGAARQESGSLDATANPYAIGKTVEVKDQYMIGDALLVAPIAPGATSRKVVLPRGRWYDFYTGRFAGDGEPIEVAPPLSQIPLFVKDGSLIPMIGERQWIPAAGEIVPLEVRHYGERPGQLSLYDDEGETFDYEHGLYSRTGLHVAPDPQGQWRGVVSPDPSGRPWSYSDVTWTFMTQP
ncbi:MAG TPA: TIM-barrel domain-containing protein [Opitutaceae bacterium]